MPLPVPRVGGYATEAQGKGRDEQQAHLPKGGDKKVTWKNGEFTTTTPSLSMSESMSASATLPLSDTTTVAPTSESPADQQQEGSSEGRPATTEESTTTSTAAPKKKKKDGGRGPEWLHGPLVLLAALTAAVLC
ncbi:uncharacterized protein TM35_000262500 [Trypanosoma theileri]|uniref:Uncharacterized protein n=1 Tax=Trypanosoma theileri TaxID=67003 RepID=A0A1X0NQJ7_9TRYP|nr:uncharacterized protein TM35_000262500 [Trypanosoma theileri]ORC86798.1 hypothetical protein TM35_000262500 [Trypanosoma theileri]